MLKDLSLPPLEKGRVGVGIALRIVRPLHVARDPLLASPFQGEECVSMSGALAASQVKTARGAACRGCA
jgi:hypothetical protein